MMVFLNRQNLPVVAMTAKVLPDILQDFRAKTLDVCPGLFGNWICVDGILVTLTIAAFPEIVVATNIQPLKSIYEIQFFPVLEQARIEAIAVKVRRDAGFPDWVKNPSVINLMNKKRREQMFFEAGRVRLDLDGLVDGPDRLNTLKSLQVHAFQSLESEKLLRVGFRQWYALTVDGRSEAELFKKLRSRFFARDIVDLTFGSLPDDMAVVFEWDQCEWWHLRRIEFGAMSKKEWFERIKYPDVTVQRKDSKESKWFDEIQNILPSSFLFMDIDTFWLSVPPTGKPPEQDVDIVRFFDHIETQNQGAATRLLEVARN